MAKSKATLIEKGKKIGLNLKGTMSIYELEHRIADRKAELEKEKSKETPEKPKKKVSGEY